MEFVVSGYYGCGNAGDEAVLAGIDEALRRRSEGAARLVVLSQDPAETRRLHGLPAVNRMRLHDLRTMIRGCDALLSGGGSLLQDVTSARSLLYYLWVARIAFQMHKPVMFYAQGMGPLRRRMSRALVRLVANHAAYITVRDDGSAQLLKRIGVTNPNVEVTADPAFALAVPNDETIDRIFEAEGLPTREPIVGVALRRWGERTPFAEYAALLTELERQCNARVALLPMQHPNDVEFAEAVAARAGLSNTFQIVRGNYTPRELLGVVSRMRGVVAMRLHTLIFAARAAVPAFALTYDPKVESLMNRIGLEDQLESWMGFDPVETAERVADLLSRRAEVSADLAVRARELERLAYRNADCAIAVANGRKPPRLITDRAS